MFFQIIQARTLKLQPFRGGASKNIQKRKAVEAHKTTYEDFEVIGREKSRGFIPHKSRGESPHQEICPKIERSRLASTTFSILVVLKVYNYLGFR